jgi:hypothetical protein
LSGHHFPLYKSKELPPVREGSSLLCGRKWCRDPELNRGRKDFQSFALPTELSRRNVATIMSMSEKSDMESRGPASPGPRDEIFLLSRRKTILKRFLFYPKSLPCQYRFRPLSSGGLSHAIGSLFASSQVIIFLKRPSSMAIQPAVGFWPPGRQM